MSLPEPPYDLSSLRARRRHVRRRRMMLRADIAIGVLVAVIVLVVGPGLALVAIGALVVLLVCLGSLAVERGLARRRSRRRPPAPD